MALGLPLPFGVQRFVDRFVGTAPSRAVPAKRVPVSSPVAGSAAVAEGAKAPAAVNKATGGGDKATAKEAAAKASKDTR